MTLGEKIDKLFEIREAKLKAAELVTNIGNEFDAVQKDIIAHMKTEDVRAAKGLKATASVGLKFVSSVEDIEKFVKWIVKNEKFYFIQKRTSSGAVKEMYESTNKLPPGTTSYTEPKLNLRRT